MHIFSNLDWLAIGLAAVSYFILGAIWYSKALFGKKWAALVGLDMSDTESKKGLGQMLTASLVLTIITVIALAILVSRLELSVLLSGIKLGLITGLCFATTAVSISFIYESRPLGIYLIDCGYHVCGHVLAAVVLVVM